MYHKVLRVTVRVRTRVRDRVRCRVRVRVRESRVGSIIQLCSRVRYGKG